MRGEETLTHLRAQLAQLRAGVITVSTFTQQTPSPNELLALLPERFAPVWHGLMDRLQSSALFSEESCSFSQTDLIDSLSLWVDKAQQELQRSE
ncbi:MAG: hypothetical protein RLZZ24_664 [Pseudomonadota bacterium]